MRLGAFERGRLFFAKKERVMKVVGQALVVDTKERRKRWGVLLTPFPFVHEAGKVLVRHEHFSDEVDPEKAITEAIRKHVEYGHTFRAAVPGRAGVDDWGRTSHPSVRDGWLIVIVETGLGVELPGRWAVRLQGYGGARDTSIEQVDETEL